MSDESDITLPKIPPGDGPAAFISTPEVEEVIPNLGTALAGPEEISVGSLAFSPAVIPATVAGYTAGGETTLDQIEGAIRSRATATERGKFSKYDSYYFPQSPAPPAAWEYVCETCRFYHEPDTAGDDPKCGVVGHEEDAFGGENIHPRGWCAYWMPKDGQGYLEWITDRLEGEDSTDADV